MRTFIVVTLLSAGILLATVSTPPALGQGKKDKVTTTSGGHIEIGKGKDGKYRFTIRTADEKYLGMSAAYATEKEVHEAIEVFRKVVATAKVSMKKDKSKE